MIDDEKWKKAIGNSRRVPVNGGIIDSLATVV